MHHSMKLLIVYSLLWVVYTSIGNTNFVLYLKDKMWLDNKFEMISYCSFDQVHIIKQCNISNFKAMHGWNKVKKYILHGYKTFYSNNINSYDTCHNYNIVILIFFTKKKNDSVLLIEL